MHLRELSCALFIAPLSMLFFCGASKAHAEEQGLRMVWHTTHKCAPPTDLQAPGATPERAIAPDEFRDPADDALAGGERADEKAASESRFACKWVRLNGFFAPIGYYHYRGRLYESAWARYRQSGVSYIVENFSAPAQLRSAIAHRRVTIVGRFYDLCASAPAGPDVTLVFGPCHYGAGNGMTLADVIVEKVDDAAPAYLLGEQNRMLVGGLLPIEDDKSVGLTKIVRDWVLTVKRGPRAYADYLLATDPIYKQMKDDERRRVREDITDPDGYIAYLSGLRSFQQMNPTLAPVAVFWNGPTSRALQDSVVGCICLKSRCTDEWPLTSGDAESFYGSAACTSFEQRDGQWLWR